MNKTIYLKTTDSNYYVEIESERNTREGDSYARVVESSEVKQQLSAFVNTLKCSAIEEARCAVALWNDTAYLVDARPLRLRLDAMYL